MSRSTDFVPRIARMFYLVSLSSVANGLLLAGAVDGYFHENSLALALMTKVIYLAISVIISLVIIAIHTDMYGEISMDRCIDKNSPMIKMQLRIGLTATCVAVFNILTAFYLLTWF